MQQITPISTLPVHTAECDSPDMPTWAEVVNDACKARYWTQAELARQAKLSANTITGIVKGKHQPGWDTLMKIEQAVGWPPGEMRRRFEGEAAEPMDDTVTPEERMSQWEREVAAMFTLVSEQDRAEVMADLRRRVARQMNNRSPEKGAAGV